MIFEIYQPVFHKHILYSISEVAKDTNSTLVTNVNRKGTSPQNHIIKVGTISTLVKSF